MAILELRRYFCTQLSTIILEKNPRSFFLLLFLSVTALFFSEGKTLYTIFKVQIDINKLDTYHFLKQLILKSFLKKTESIVLH